MTIHEIRTTLMPADVIGRARSFFALAGTPYAAFAEVVGEGFVKLHMEVGEIVIAALPRGDYTCVRGSASRGAHVLTSFLTSLAPPLEAKQATHRYKLHETQAAQVETLADDASRRNLATGPRGSGRAGYTDRDRDGNSELLTSAAGADRRHPAGP